MKLGECDGRKGRIATLADVWVVLDNLGVTGTPQPIPAATNGLTLPTTLIEAPKVCTLTVSNELAIRAC
jgi:hypothetical protein